MQEIFYPPGVSAVPGSASGKKWFKIFSRLDKLIKCYFSGVSRGSGVLVSVFCRRLYNFALYGVLWLLCVFVRAVVVSALCGACGALCVALLLYLVPFSALSGSPGAVPLWMLAGFGSVARSGFICGPLWAFVLFRVCFFIRGAFCRPVGVSCVGCWQRFRFWFSRCGFGCFAAFGRGYSVKFCPVAVPGFGYNIPVVFSGSFSDPLRLLLFSWFNNSRRRASFPVAVLRVGCGFNMSLLLARVRLICRNRRRGWACIR